MKQFTKHHWAIFLVILAAVLSFTWLFLSAGNAEFLIYVAVIIFLTALIIHSNKTIHWSFPTLWGLTIWALLHMSGGGVYIGEIRLYDLILIPLSDELPILKYDQVVHAFGFFVATFVAFELLKPSLSTKINHWKALSLVLIMAGLGFGALNEILEFLATLIAPETGVGGYINTSLDLVFNFIGAVIATLIIRWKYSS